LDRTEPQSVRPGNSALKTPCNFNRCKTNPHPALTAGYSGYLHDCQQAGGFPLFCQRLYQNLDGHLSATAAGAAATSGPAQLLESTYTIINRISNMRIGYSITDTYVHKSFLVVDKIILNANENHCQLALE
jgi:hypothetical protein